MQILIPAYEPDERLVELLTSLRAAAPDQGVVVVDDGSGPAHREVFRAVRALGFTVISYPTNRGKGHALRVGLEHVAEHHPGQDVVTADCDGQHSLVDVLRVAQVLGRSRDAIVLGSRRFTGHVPARSRFGNAVTRLLFRLATGRRVSDTQTGLRGYPAPMIPWLLTVKGDRFEYELDVLLQAVRDHRDVVEVEIATIYLDENASSHFRPVADSLRIYGPLLRFALASFGAFLADTAVLLVLVPLSGNLLASVVAARVVSSTVNFVTNRSFVFEHGRAVPLGAAAARYWTLVVALLAANYGLLCALTGAGLPLVVAKVVTEAVLFAVSYLVQKTLVFGRRRRTPESQASGDPHHAHTSAPLPRLR